MRKTRIQHARAHPAVAVNPNILSVTGLNFEGLVFATAFSSFVATLMMALWANIPFGVWPGMGMNAYFAYTIVGFKGTGYPVKRVMFAVFIEGVIFIIISLLDLRRPLIKIFPNWLLKAVMAGIGLFLTHIGLQAGNGIDIIRDNAAVLVDVTILEAPYAGRVWVGIAIFILMATLIVLRVPGAIMIGILTGTFFCWILEAAESPQFTYQPMCCLGEVSYPPTGSAHPDNNGWYPKPTGGWMPKPTCVDAKFVQPGDEVLGTYGNWSINGEPHMGALEFKGNGEGRNSAFNGDCSNMCFAIMASWPGFAYFCLPWPDSPQPPVQISTGCWSGMAYKENDASITASIKGASFEPATNKGDYSASLGPYTQVDGFGEGCIGGAGRIPRTFKHPTAFASAPKAEVAGDIVSPWPGWFGCPEATPGVENSGCFAGDIAGGTIAAFDTEDLTMDNFGRPLITLLFLDFIGTAMFLYAAADLTGLVDPEKPDNFQGCYAAFMADAVGTFFGGLMGTSSVTTYGESMAGVYEGGRTGLTALVIAFCNFLCIFLTPFIASIPTIATGPALMMVGVFMIEGVKGLLPEHRASRKTLVLSLMQSCPITPHRRHRLDRLLSGHPLALLHHASAPHVQDRGRRARRDSDLLLPPALHLPLHPVHPTDLASASGVHEEVRGKPIPRQEPDEEA